MPFYFKKVPSIIQRLFSQRTWSVDHDQEDAKVLYLTYDDGPHPDITPDLLALLSKFHAKVTFFQLGSKIELYPSLSEACIADGHTVAGHGYNHLDGWRTSPSIWYDNAVRRPYKPSSVKLYRPAYGRLPLFNKKKLKGYQIVMWDIMPGDFDMKRTVEECIGIVASKAKSGSIICLHENEKSKAKVVDITAGILEQFTAEGFVFKSLGD